MSFARYDHHGTYVFVRADLAGRHREHCLCHSCERFHPGEESNCPIAAKIFRLCVEEHLVTPVWECPKFEEKKT